MKRLNKKTGIAIFTAVMAILAVIILVYHNPLANPQDELLKKVIACVLIVAAVIAFIRLYDKITVLPVELYQNRRLIWKLAKSDFKKRYAGSYMGAFWAMVQPVITVAMYWVVFVIIFPNRTGYASGGVGRCSVYPVSDSGTGALVLFFRSSDQRNGIAAGI